MVLDREEGYGFCRWEATRSRIAMIVNDTRRYHATKPPHMTVEISTAMALTINSDALESGLSYGRVLSQEIHQRLLRMRPHARGAPLVITESGPGLGWLSYDFLVALAGPCGQPYHYTAFDIAPNLMQASVLSRGDIPATYRTQDAHRLKDAAEPESIDVFLANEMVGDMLTLDRIPEAWLKGKLPPDGVLGADAPYLRQLRGLLARHGIPVEKCRRQAYNLGALQLVEDLYGLMKPQSIKLFPARDHTTQFEYLLLTKK